MHVSTQIKKNGAQNGAQKKPAESVDLVHLAGNLQEYASWEDRHWMAFKNIALDAQATPQECREAMFLCLQLDLNPVRKEIYFIRRQGKLTAQASISGFHKVAHSTGMFEGFTEPEWCDENEVWHTVWNKKAHGNKPPIAARIGVFHKNFRAASPVVAHWDDYCPASGQDHMWKKMPAHMLLKVAKACALRDNFHALSGVYTDDEMAQAGGVTIAVDESTFTPQEPVAEEIAEAEFVKPDPEWIAARERLFEMGAIKFPDKNTAQQKALVAMFCEKFGHLYKGEDGRVDLQRSTKEEILLAAEALEAWKPEQKDATETKPETSAEVHEGELVDDGPDIGATIESYEAQLSGIADVSAREEWSRAELARARVEAGDIFGHPDGDWTEEQKQAWASWLESRLSANADQDVDF